MTLAKHFDAIRGIDARAHIKATITPRNEAELLHAIAGIKRAAAELADMLFTSPPKEDEE